MGVVMCLAFLIMASPAVAQVATPVPPALRGAIDAERKGLHDANNIRTIFYNYGMVGDFFGGADLSVSHSSEVPKGSGINYSDGVTPFIMAKVKQRNGFEDVTMETGYRERQATSPFKNRIMRFEPRPGYQQADPNINRGRSIATSNDPRTWPDTWLDKGGDANDPGWRNSWNGYFGKRPAADLESYSVMDDDFYDALDYYPDSRDSTRRGLGLRVEVRGFQWANPQAGNVIFWHYDITNESTTEYNENIVFGIYFDAGVGGSQLSCDGVFESDDDNAAFDTTGGLNLVYTWDRGGRGVGVSGNCLKTGYLGYAYLETPGKPFDAIDNDNDGIRNEDREDNAGGLIIGQAAIRAYAASNYDLSKFEAFYGKLETRPAFRAGRWWTGDEDMDWIASLNDFGADGIPDTQDAGELDGKPTQGETNYGKTDLNESDQIGLTGFKFNRIARAGGGTTGAENMNFYNDSRQWNPRTLYEKFTSPDSVKFDVALVENWNMGFFFASGPFTLKPGQTERFSLALVYGSDLRELRGTTKIVKSIYDANYQFAVPPPTPKVSVESGDKYVRLTWDDGAELGIDPVSNINDFEGYRIYRSTDPTFLDTRRQTDNRGNPLPGNGTPIAQFDLIDGKFGDSKQSINGVKYDLGSETGIVHTWTDTTVTNGQQYYYAVCAYDFGLEVGSADSVDFYPSESSIAVSRTPRGGTILPGNVIIARPNPKVLGYVPATASAVSKRGPGVGSAEVRVVNSSQIPDGHVFNITFNNVSPDSIRASSYNLIDSTAGRAAFTTGTDLLGEGRGPNGFGVLPVVKTPERVQVDSISGFQAGKQTNIRGLKVTYRTGEFSSNGNIFSDNFRRTGYPRDLTVTFADTPLDTCLPGFGLLKSVPVQFKSTADTGGGTAQLKCFFLDGESNLNTPPVPTLNSALDYIDITTYPSADPADLCGTWRLQLDTTGLNGAPVKPLGAGDVFNLKLTVPFSNKDTLRFTSTGIQQNEALAQAQFAVKPYVVPNPYVGAATFEEERFAVSGRGNRRLEFRGLPARCTIRIYTLRGELVNTLTHDGSNEGFVAWNLRTKDNLDLAPGLYIYHVDAGSLGTAIDKFAVIK